MTKVVFLTCHMHVKELKNDLFAHLLKTDYCRIIVMVSVAIGVFDILHCEPVCSVPRVPTGQGKLETGNLSGQGKYFLEKSGEE